jgi:hypothetical protein
MTEPARHLHVVDEDGVVVEGGCPACAVSRDEIDGLKDTVTKLGAQIREMKRNRDAERRVHPHRSLIEDIHGFWHDVTGRKGKLGAKRFDTVADAIKVEVNDGDDDWKIRLAIIGAAVAPNRSDAGEPFDDLELICRDETKIDSFARRAYLWGERVRKVA